MAITISLRALRGGKERLCACVLLSATDPPKLSSKYTLLRKRPSTHPPMLTNTAARNCNCTWWEAVRCSLSKRNPGAQPYQLLIMYNECLEKVKNGSGDCVNRSNICCMRMAELWTYTCRPARLVDGGRGLYPTAMYKTLLRYKNHFLRPFLDVGFSQATWRRRLAADRNTGGHVHCCHGRVGRTFERSLMMFALAVLCLSVQRAGDGFWGPFRSNRVGPARIEESC
eukprot:scaffold363476_cov96-Cyclotella_meneghiniana.AAC.3